MADTTIRLRAALERRAQKRTAMEKAWTELVTQVYDVQAALEAVHSRALRNDLAPATLQALARARKTLANAVLALEEDPCLPPSRKKKRKQVKKGSDG